MSNYISQNVPRAVEISPTLWFDDGDIVIKGHRPDNGNVLHYKLHRDLLVVHAPVFLEFLDELVARDRVALCGTPVAYVREHRWELDMFLQALHHPSSLLRWKYMPWSFQLALPLYEMALKYKVDYITDVLKAQLEQEWPKTIWEWDAFESDDALYIRGGRDMYQDMNPEPVAAIRFARLANLPSILPAAFYHLSTIITSCDFEKQVTLGNRTLLSRHCARWSELSKEDFLCLTAGKEQLAFCMMNLQIGLANVIPAEETKCREAWTLMPTIRSDDLLRDLQEICKPDKLPGAFMCKACRDKMNERARKEREAIWVYLPMVFNLPESC